jgi:hypothetical protein
MLRRSVLLGAAALLASAGAVLARPMPRVRFPRGASGVTLEGAVARGETNTYPLGASAGQSMTVNISSTEENAVFQIYDPDGDALLGAGEGDDATSFSDTLPSTGTYRIVVGATRGGADYTLSIEIT